MLGVGDAVDSFADILDPVPYTELPCLALRHGAYSY